MKTVKMMMIVMLVVLSHSFVYAQRDTGMITIGGIGMYDIQTNPKAFKDFQQNGIGFAGKAKYHLSKNTAIGISFQNHGFDFDQEEFQYEINAFSEGELVSKSQNGAWNVNAVHLTLTQYSRDKDLPFDFFVELGLGYYMIEVKDMNYQLSYQGVTIEDSVMVGEDLSGFGASFSAGLEKSLVNHVTFVLGATFHMTTLKKEENEILATLGKKGGVIQYLSIFSGLNFNF